MKTKEKKYVNTKETCEKQIKQLGDVVCPRCGKNLEPIETVDNARNPTYWVGCMHGSEDFGHFTHGVKPEIYEVAKKIVLEDWQRQTNIFHSVDNDEKFELWFMEQVDSWCRIITTMKRFENKNAKPRFTFETLKERIIKYGAS